MGSVRIRPSGPLSGRVRIRGAKNSALKLMAATVLAPGTSTLHNVPRISDVEWMGDVLASLGMVVERRGEALVIDSSGDLVPEADREDLGLHPAPAAGEIMA